LNNIILITLFIINMVLGLVIGNLIKLHRKINDVALSVSSIDDQEFREKSERIKERKRIEANFREYLKERNK